VHGRIARMCHRGLDAPARWASWLPPRFRAPRSWVEKVVPNLVHFNEVAKGGHFAAWEEPQLAFSSLRE
jgi:hypothetical protein